MNGSLADCGDHHPFTAKQRCDKALGTLQGMLDGIQADQVLKPVEVALIHQWMDEHQRESQEGVRYDHVLERVRGMLSDHVFTSEEREEITDIIANTRTGFYDDLTYRIQRLHGMMAGIAADGIITPGEITALRDWVDDQSDLADRWPFTETSSLILNAVRNGKVDPEHHDQLLVWFSGFIEISGHKTLTSSQVGGPKPLHGIAAANVDLIFEQRIFCLTGKSYKGLSRRQIAEHIIKRGGIVIDTIRRDLDYLIYCDAGQRSWAYDCYGRKVEAVLDSRKNGGKTLIIAERDFWDTLGES